MDFLHRLSKTLMLPCFGLLLLLIHCGAAQAQQTLYDDHLGNGWASYSWATVKFDATAPVHGGTNSIGVTVAAGSYGALELRTAPFEASKYTALTFWLNGGPAGGQNQLVVKASVSGKQQGSVAIPALTANTWTKITVSLSDLGVANSAQLTGFLIQQNSADPAPTFYVDDIQLTAAAPQVPLIHRGAIKPLPFTGVNISGGEFDDRQQGAGSVFGTNYVYPSTGEMDYFAGKGVNIIRFPFHWPDLQPVLNQPLSAAVLGRIKAVVAAATERGQVVILDLHDYARYNGKLIGGPEISDAAFADFWGRTAAEFKGNQNVWFGLVNEPHDMPNAQWLSAANAAIAAIRKSGANNLILVPGIAWTGAHDWVSSGNGATMLGVVDPKRHYIYEVHQYLDSDNSGSHPEAVSATIGSERLQDFTLWARQHHQRGFLGEFGAADNPTALAAADDMLRFMEKNRDVWVGYTWWAAGAWWGDYMFTVEPKTGQDRPQMAILRPHLQIKTVRGIKAVGAKKAADQK
ncbi:MAG: glycoside hydrolase family 5 protein [Janthinobacterium lividum]